MALPPGLLPDSSETRPSRAPLVLGAAVFAALIALAALLVQNRRLAAERNEAVEKLIAERKRAAEPSPPPAPLPPPPATTPVAAQVSTPPPATPARRRADEAWPFGKPEEPQFIPRGLQEFRAGRYDQAERQFFRAFPDSLLYLSLTSLAQRNWREAFSFLARAMTADPKWLQRVNPRDLFGKEGDYEALLQALDDQLAKNPIDADLKTLAAYLRFHEKGAPYAKALLIEATNLNPDHEAAKTFLEALGP